MSTHVRSSRYNSRPQGYRKNSRSTQLCMIFIMLINVKMPKNVGILTFMSMINTIYEGLKARDIFICRYFSFFEQLKFRAQLSWARKKSFITSGPDLPRADHHTVHVVVSIQVCLSSLSPAHLHSPDYTVLVCARAHQLAVGGLDDYQGCTLVSVENIQT